MKKTGIGYSTDLRERVVEARWKKGMTPSKVSRIFGVGEATVKRWCRLKREQGSVEPLSHGRGRRCLLGAGSLEQLRQLVNEKNDRTIPELVNIFSEKFGIKLSTSTMSRYLLQLGLTFKKKSSKRHNVTAKIFKAGSNSFATK